MSPTCQRGNITIYSLLMLSLDLGFNNAVLKEPFFDEIYLHGRDIQKLFSFDVILGSYFQ